MLRRFAFALLAALASLAPTCPTTRARVAAVAPSKTVVRGDEDPARVAWSRAARLRRGVNLSHWFSQSPGRDYSETHLRTHTTARDIALIKEMGFDHVRFPFEPAPLFDEEHPSDLNPEYLRR